MKFGFLTDLSVTKVAEACFDAAEALLLCQRYPDARDRILGAHQGGRALWRYNTDLQFMSEIVGLVTVEEGSLTDFSSVPRMPFAYWLAGDTAHASAGVHDKLCSEDYEAARISWRTAADVFREAMKHEGVPAWRRTLMHWAVTQADPDSNWEAA